MDFTETQYSFSLFCEPLIDISKLLLPVVILPLEFPVVVDPVGIAPDLFWCSLDEEAVMRIFSLVFADIKGVFILGVERNYGSNHTRFLMYLYLWVLCTNFLNRFNRLEELNNSRL